MLPETTSYQGGTLNPFSQNYSGTAGTSAVSGSKRWMKDFITPNAKRLMREGKVINNPARSLFITSTPLISSVNRTVPGSNAWENDQGAWQSAAFGRLVVGDENDPSLYPYDSLKVDRLSRLATINTWKNVQPPQSQALVSWAEKSKTWETLYRRAKQLADIVQSVRKGDIKRLEDLLPGKRTKNYPRRVVMWDSFSDVPLTDRRGKPVSRYGHKFKREFDPKTASSAAKLWLEYRYGWSPIVYDMVDMLKATYAEDLRLSRQARPFLTAHGQAKDKWEDSMPLSVVLGNIGILGTRKVNYELEVRGYILYRDDAVSLFRRLNDFGIFDAPRAIWELAPLSFVVDWFVPVGDFLGAIQPKVGVEIIASGNVARYRTLIEQSGYQYGTPDYPSQGWSPVFPLGAPDKASIELMVRNIGLGFPLIPPLNVNLTFKRLIDAAALISGMRQS